MVDSPPSEGDTVIVRGERWTVAATHPAEQGSTFVRLESLAEGRFGATIDVIWELEPGRRIVPHHGLPTVEVGRFDPPERLAAFLDAQRWSAVRSAETNLLQAPFRSGIVVEPFQLEPLARAVESPRINQLLADDVGLGKTIQSGLIVLELLLRQRVSRVMVMCPAGLVLKWHDELFEKFGLKFQIVDSKACAGLRRSHGSAANPFHIHPLTIVSLPWLRGARPQRLLSEVLPPGKPGSKRFFDLLILDEAHHVSPAAPDRLRSHDSQQTRLIRRLSPHFEHRLFLSATPHNGYVESFSALMELVDPQRFVRGVPPDRKAMREVIVRRLKRDIVDADGSSRFPERVIRQVELTYSADEARVHRLMQEFTELRRHRRITRNGLHGSTDLVTLLLKKRLISSPAAFARTAELVLRNAAATQALDGDDLLDEYEEVAACLDDEELAEWEDTVLARGITGRNGHLSDDEADLLRQVAAWATEHRGLPDTKAARLIAMLRDVCRPDGRWNDERVTVFTEYRDTQEYLATMLRQQGLGGERLDLLHGGMTPDDREQLRLAFQAPPGRHPLRILLATDAAGEGIDLQRHCHRLVNYDVPFNPSRLEQRIGRIDRYGQRRSPLIYHFVPAGWDAPGERSGFTGELEYLARIAVKVGQVRQDLGAVNSVLAVDLQHRMSGETVPTVDDTVRRHTPRQPGIPAQPDLSIRTRRLADQVKNTVEELHLTPKSVQRVVSTALHLAHQQPLQELPEPGLFQVPTLTKDWVRASDGLVSRLRGAGDPISRPVTFDPQKVRDDDVVLAHLNHPLVTMSTQLLRAAALNDDLGVHRVTALVHDAPGLSSVLVGVFARFVVVGAAGVRLHEEVLHAGGFVSDDGRFQRARVRQPKQILESALADGRPASIPIRHRLVRLWPRIREALNGAMQVRTGDRLASIQKILTKQAATERDRIIGDFEAFGATLRTMLEGPPREPGMPALDPAPTSHHIDREHLQARLRELDRERDHELDAIDRRYRGPRPHLFPLAVVFVVPGWQATRLDLFGRALYHIG